MYSKPPTKYAPKGSVSIISSKNWLQLRFRVNGHRYYLSLGKPDTPYNRKMAQYTATEIEKDIHFQRFDPTLQKYKTNVALSTTATQTASKRPPISTVCTPITPIQTPQLHLDQIWDKYSEFKKPQVSPSTYAKDFVKHKNHIAKLPTRSLGEASEIRNFLLKELSLNAAKRCLTQIKAACNWAYAEGLITHNPFATMTIRTPHNAKDTADVQPFSKQERDLIIDTFAKDSYFSYYTNYVRFLFFTGCRPSEAVALRWKHITPTTIRFENSVVISEDGLVLKEGLKTQKKREFPLTPEIKEILEDVRAEAGADPDALVFVSPKGKYIDHHNFSSRAWKTILEKAKIPYRKSYQTRHTFISQCVEANINTTAIGRWTGTSAKMIDNNYGATNFTNLRPPNLR